MLLFYKNVTEGLAKFHGVIDAYEKREGDDEPERSKPHGPPYNGRARLGRSVGVKDVPVKNVLYVGPNPLE